MRLDGLALDGSSGGGVNQLVAAFAGGDTQQDGLAAVASTVTVTGGEAPYTYAVTLRDPRGADRTALLTGASTATPGFTPEVLIGSGGDWTLRATVTDGGGRTATAVKAVTVGRAVAGGPNWVEVLRYVSNGSDAASPSGGTLAFGGLTWTIVNADAASGPKVDGGDLSITPAPSTQITGGSFGGTAALRISLSTLTGLSTIGTRRIMVCAEMEDYTPTTSEEGFLIGLEVAGSGLGSGSGGRGIAAGQGVSSTTLRTSRIVSQIGTSSILRTSYATATATPCRSFAVIFCQSGVMAYSSTTANALDTAAEVVAATPRQSGSGDAPNTYGALDQFLIAVQKPPAGANGAEFRLKELRVLVC